MNLRFYLEGANDINWSYRRKSQYKRCQRFKDSIRKTK